MTVGTARDPWRVQRLPQRKMPDKAIYLDGAFVKNWTANIVSRFALTASHYHGRCNRALGATTEWVRGRELVAGTTIRNAMNLHSGETVI